MSKSKIEDIILKEKQLRHNVNVTVSILHSILTINLPILICFIDLSLYLIPLQVFSVKVFIDLVHSFLFPSVQNDIEGQEHL